MLLFKPDKYVEPHLMMNNEEKIIPILLKTTEWYKGSQKLSRTTFSIQLAFAITVYKLQGLTLE